MVRGAWILILISLLLTAFASGQTDSASSSNVPSTASGSGPAFDVNAAVEAYLAICGLLDQGGGAGEAFNAGAGEPRSVLEVVELICELAGTGVAPDVRASATGAGEIDRQWVDGAKLRAAAGWEPAVALEDGLRRTIAWYREYLPARARGAAKSPHAPADHRG